MLVPAVDFHDRCSVGFDNAVENRREQMHVNFAMREYFINFEKFLTVPLTTGKKAVAVL